MPSRELRISFIRIPLARGAALVGRLGALEPLLGILVGLAISAPTKRGTHARS